MFPRWPSATFHLVLYSRKNRSLTPEEYHELLTPPNTKRIQTNEPWFYLLNRQLFTRRLLCQVCNIEINLYNTYFFSTTILFRLIFLHIFLRVMDFFVNILWLIKTILWIFVCRNITIIIFLNGVIFRGIYCYYYVVIFFFHFFGGSKFKESLLSLHLDISPLTALILQ